MQLTAGLLLVYAATAFVISILFFPVLIKVLRQWKLFDSPGRHKIHLDFTPSVGGLPIVAAVTFSLLIAMPLSELVSLKYLFISIALMFITGLRDDILTLSPSQKMLGQILPVLILVLYGDALLKSFYGAAPVGEFPSIVAAIVSIFTIIILTNAYNLIDGIDGLAGGIGLITLILFGTWFFVVGNNALALICFAFAGAVLAFLFFNWQPSRIFMGDTGALTLGFLLSYLCIRFINDNYALPPDNPARFEASISTAVCVLIIPVFDTLRVIIFRLRKMQSPFRADKNHLHHQFLNMGFSHAKTVIVLVSINLGFILLAWILRSKGDTLILPIVAGLCLLINEIIKLAQKRYAIAGRKGHVVQE